MERKQEQARLTEDDWGILENTILPLARNAAASTGFMEHTSSDNNSWMYWRGINADSIEGIQAVCTSSDGGITDYCIEISTRNISRVFLSSSMPDLGINSTAILDPDGLSVSDVTFLYPGETDPDLHSTFADVQAAISDQIEFGADIPTGEDLIPLHIFISDFAVNL